MADNYGSGVSRVLTAAGRQFSTLIFQQGKPPLDSEFNLLSDMADEGRRGALLRDVPSGFLGNPVNMMESFITNPIWSNWFRLGQQRSGEKNAVEWAAVNGWLIPVASTLTGTPPGSPNDSDTWNRITLDPPPANSGDSRIDFVFLEVWKAKIGPNPSATNKPSASGLWKYGNVEGGTSFLADDLQDPAIGFETTQRVQLQYRIRVVTGLIGLTTYPDGFDPTVVKARGAAASNTSFVFANMREELGDPGLWRAGDGTANSLGTVDGYSYAIPICCVFRRNSVAWDGDPSQNLNGGFNRNPTAVDRTGWKTFSTSPTLASGMNSAQLTLSLSSATNVPLPLTPATPVIIQVGNEYMTYSSITGTTMTLTARGLLGSRAESHFTGDAVKVVAGRPDGLFADQVAKTDILDLRHAVNPNGFDYDTLLRCNLDKALRGELRSNWKRSGGGPQGCYVTYQDKVSASAPALGVTKLDAPDNIRTVFSDAAMVQKIEFVITAPTGQGAAQSVTTSWSLGLTGTADNSGGASGQLNPSDTITIPINQFKLGIPGSDVDQVTFLGSESGAGSVSMRLDGESYPLQEGTLKDFTVAAITGPNDNLVITLRPTFPSTANPRRIYVQLHVMYGSGRGVSRRPDSVHSMAYLTAGSDIMHQLSGVPANNIPMRTAWALTWSKFRRSMFRNLLPVTAEAYVDPGSKTIVLTPFRRMELPSQLRALDGTVANANTAEVVTSAATGSTSAASAVFTDLSANFSGAGVVVGDILIINGSTETPRRVAGTITGTTFVTDALSPTAGGQLDFRTSATGLSYTIVKSQGLMPLEDLAGAAKWATTDPLALFSGTTQADANRKNIYVPLERSMVPGWGAVRVPILHSDPTSLPPGGTSTFDQGINFGILTKKGATPGNSEANYVPFTNGALSYAPFSTWNFTGAAPAAYNTAFTFSGNSFAGMRFFTDTRGLSRQGLELPPFYGVARLWAVYERADYQAAGSAFDPTTRQPTGGGAVNLLKQDFDGDTMWIEIDADGDSTFVLNAACIDIARSPNVIANFAAGHYVIEASIFGFDRGTFDLAQAPRLVLNRNRDSGQANSGTRANNFGMGANALIDSPDLALPGPALASDEVAINYSRSPYQGDAWGSQTSQTDMGHQQGPMTTGSLFQVTSTDLNEAALSRPNQKALEVLSAVGFATTLGSGRLAGDYDPSAGPFDPRSVGYEDTSVLPPATGTDPRPEYKVSALTNDEAALTLGTEYHGCVSRLPLGSEFRDKDFRGGFVNSPDTAFTPAPRSPLVLMDNYAPGLSAVGVGVESSLEQVEMPVNTASVASGQPGEVLVQVDGEPGNYALLLNYRTNRGGSVFTASGPRPGGELNVILDQSDAGTSFQGVLSGVAMLVRNTVTDVGANEVSAGSELMMLIATSGRRLPAAGSSDAAVFIGTNGSGEGKSAADLYRLQGRPLVRDHVRVEIDPSSIQLTKSTGV